MAMKVPYKTPYEFPVYQDLVQCVEAMNPSSRVVNWWYNLVHDRVVETLWSIIKGKLSFERVTSTQLQDVFTWSYSEHGNAFWETVWKRIQCGRITFNGENHWS